MSRLSLKLLPKWGQSRHLSLPATHMYACHFHSPTCGYVHGLDTKLRTAPCPEAAECWAQWPTRLMPIQAQSTTGHNTSGHPGSPTLPVADQPVLHNPPTLVWPTTHEALPAHQHHPRHAAVVRAAESHVSNTYRNRTAMINGTQSPFQSTLHPARMKIGVWAAVHPATSPHTHSTHPHPDIHMTGAASSAADQPAPM
jgi:hypothetical protein